ncbi:response regulator [Flammeovirga yaeyamensis]|uniref:Response regulator n=1 Tax=Flammeovirga yaeyamensis TaxID=367791 RepID=A0AAX1N6I1_9BACT|nr:MULTISPECIES: response regulator [Flammeovirga]ANQ50960.1 response regulator [Flammeovirga sp. MY04]MBB3701161.1 CheY-like chemotaxis protein [Flammeovirga yaeyamensis]NMF38372.1 response regulator [Flammeovirga yaeyamensis]QWG01627.1 response regulator [Flammeovirga yaeyamensis]
MSKKIKTILLVDDNDTDNFINSRIIELTEFAEEIIIKNSGKKALEFLQERLDQNETLPSLILLDINMPIVDGFVFLYEFENFADELKNKCKIAILSSSDNESDIERIVNNEYVIKFITKPLTEESLLEVGDLLP